MSGTKRALSSRLAGMSFMKRREERDTRDVLAKRQRVREDAAHWSAPVEPPSAPAKRAPIVVIERGYGSDADDAPLGRQSFGAFNVPLERRNAALRAGEPDPFTARAAARTGDAAEGLAELRAREANPVLVPDAPEFLLPEIVPAPVRDGAPTPVEVEVQGAIVQARKESGGKEKRRRKRKPKGDGGGMAD